jgi:hypothetical protein
MPNAILKKYKISGSTIKNQANKLSKLKKNKIINHP